MEGGGRCMCLQRGATAPPPPPPSHPAAARCRHTPLPHVPHNSLIPTWLQHEKLEAWKSCHCTVAAAVGRGGCAWVSNTCWPLASGFLPPAAVRACCVPTRVCCAVGMGLLQRGHYPPPHLCAPSAAGASCRAPASSAAGPRQRAGAWVGGARAACTASRPPRVPASPCWLLAWRPHVRLRATVLLDAHRPVSNVLPCRFGYYTALRNALHGWHLCGSSLIHPQILLTAAHVSRSPARAGLRG